MSRLLCVLLCGLCAVGAQAADIEVVLERLSPRGGRVHAVLFNDPVRFEADIRVRASVSSTGEISTGVFAGDKDLESPPNQRLSLSIPPNANTARLRFTDFPPGEYAVALFQDLDNDQKLATSLRGVPKEPWGMSNNPVIDRPAKWADASFTLTGESITIVIKMQ